MKNILTIAENEEETDFLLGLIEDLHAMTVGIIQQLDYEKDVIDGDKDVTKAEFKVYTRKNKQLNTAIFRLFEMMHGVIDWPTYIILKDKIAERVELENRIAQANGDNTEITINTSIQDKLESFKHQLSDLKHKTSKKLKDSDDEPKRKRGRPRKNP